MDALELLDAQKENESFITRDFQIQVKENGEWKENLYYANMDTPVVGDNFRL